MKMSISLSHFVRGFWSHMSRSPLESTRDSRGQLCFASERGGSPCPVIPVYKYLRVCVSVCLVITSTLPTSSSSSSSDNMTFTLSFSTHCAHERDCGAGGGGRKALAQELCSIYLCKMQATSDALVAPLSSSFQCVCVCGSRRRTTFAYTKRTSQQQPAASQCRTEAKAGGGGGGWCEFSGI